MTPVELSRTVLHAVRRVVDEGALSVDVPARVVVERPRPGGCGDYATGVALQLARPAARAPRQVAELLRERLLLAPGVAGVEITGPGFLNITLDGDQGLPALVREVLRHGPHYGHCGHYGAEPSVSSASVRPESPAAPVLLCVAPGVRAAVLADAVARILRSQGLPALLRYEDGAGPDPAWAALGVQPYEPSSAGSTGPSGGSIAASTCDSYPDRTGPTTRGRTAPATPIRPVPAPSDPLPLGRDAARWALLYPAAHDRPRITGDHLVQREGNPLFRVRYAHARTRALVRNAADLGFTSAPGDLGLPAVPVAEADTLGTRALPSGAAAGGTPTGPAPHPLATALTTHLTTHPRTLALAARRRAPDVLARHLVATADAYLAYQGAVRILPMGDEKPSAAHRARLALAEAAGTVLAGGLALLGIDAPETI